MPPTNRRRNRPEHTASRFLGVALLLATILVAGWPSPGARAELAADAPGAVASAATRSLQEAAHTNNTKAALRQLDAGAAVSAVDAAGWPPLAWAAFFGNDALVQALVSRGADLGWVAPDGATLLHLVARWPVLEPPGTAPLLGEPPSLVGKAWIAARLVRAGLDPNAADKAGATPLHAAVGLPPGGAAPQAIVATLLAVGARPSAVNAFGLTPLELARRRGATDLVDVLEAVQATEARRFP